MYFRNSVRLADGFTVQFLSAMRTKKMRRSKSNSFHNTCYFRKKSPDHCEDHSYHAPRVDLSSTSISSSAVISYHPEGDISTAFRCYSNRLAVYAFLIGFPTVFVFFFFTYRNYLLKSKEREKKNPRCKLLLQRCTNYLFLFFNGRF